MIVQDLPVLELFTRLREADLPLGIDDYQLLLRALQAGFGIADRDALIRLCRTLWVKSADDGHVFDYHFEQVMAQEMTSKISSQTSQVSDESQAKSSATQPAREYRTTEPVPTPTPEPLLKVEDDVRAAQVMAQAAGKDETAYSQFLQTDEYLPVTRRQMKQSWRHLRRPVREGRPVELDVDATIKIIGRQGIFLDPVLVPRRVNRAELLLLIDQGGSMVPFHVLSRRLVETALRGGRLGRAGIYYFHNCPMEYLYRDSAHSQAESVKSILERSYQEQAGVLIFSDAGAARGGVNQERCELTEEFLKEVRQKFRHVVWLNPVPGKRWSGTTAGEMMYLVPMFDVSRRGLDNAIRVLCGRPSHVVDNLRQYYG